MQRLIIPVSESSNEPTPPPDGASKRLSQPSEHVQAHDDDDVETDEAPPEVVALAPPFVGGEGSPYLPLRGVPERQEEDREHGHPKGLVDHHELIPDGVVVDIVVVIRVGLSDDVFEGKEEAKDGDSEDEDEVDARQGEEGYAEARGLGRVLCERGRVKPTSYRKYTTRRPEEELSTTAESARAQTQGC